MHNSSFFILHSTFFILHSSFFILHSSFFILHSAFSIQHSKPIPHPNRTEALEASAEFEAAKPMFPASPDAEKCHMRREKQRLGILVVRARIGIYIEIGCAVVGVAQVVVRHPADKFGQPKRQL